MFQGFGGTPRRGMGLRSIEPADQERDVDGAASVRPTTHRLDGLIKSRLLLRGLGPLRQNSFKKPGSSGPGMHAVVGRTAQLLVFLGGAPWEGRGC